MNVPIDHHFIPAFFLAQWADDTCKLVEYTIRHRKLIAKPVGPRATGYEPHLYSFPDLASDAAHFLETVFFNYADRVAADARRNHLSAAPAPWTTELTSAPSRASSSRSICVIPTRCRNCAPRLSPVGTAAAANVKPNMRP